ncbi:MAG: YihY/virulence factor BrkB family protein [Candidatus Promineifilaceae bacterium]
MSQRSERAGSRLGEAQAFLGALGRRLNENGRGWLALLGHSLTDALTFQSSLYAAAIAYFTLLSVFPLIVLTVSIASLWLEVPLTGDQIVARLEFVVPALSQLIGASLDTVLENRGAITRLSIISLIWSASSVFYVLTRALDNIWAGEPTGMVWRHRALSILVVVGVSLILLTLSVLWSAAVSFAQRFLPEILIRSSPYLLDVSLALLNIPIFALLYYMLPHVRLEASHVLPGAFIAGALWEGAKRLFLVVVTNYLAATNLLYGSVTTIIALLFWAYLSSLIFLFGAHVNVRYGRLQQSQLEAASQK